MTRMPWVSHFGFTRMPFSKTIPANKLCERTSHQEAVARIRFCIVESLLGVITGEVGVGKTVGVRAATSQLAPAAHHIIYISTPTFGARGLYVTMVNALGAHPHLPRAELIAQAHSLLAAEEQARRRRVVLVVDDACAWGLMRISGCGRACRAGRRSGAGGQVHRRFPSGLSRSRKEGNQPVAEDMRMFWSCCAGPSSRKMWTSCAKVYAPWLSG